MMNMLETACWRKVRNTDFKEGRLDFDLSNCRLPVKFLRAKNSSSLLIVWFHGAVDRIRLKLPAFSGPEKGFSQVAHQVAVSDPTLSRHSDLSNAWYIGDEELNAQKELIAFFAELTLALGVSRTIFVGGSGGGFASLYFSLMQEGSCAIAVQPQTNIKYFSYSQKYLEHCWSAKTLLQIDSRVCTDLCKAYSLGFKNTIIYIQSVADERHFRSHLTPFQHAIRRRSSGTAVFHVDFWGSFGHAPVPQSVVTPWIQAALVAQTLCAEDILLNYHAIRREVATSPLPHLAQETEVSTADILISDLLRDLYLSGKVG
jgi:hypothetical protein